MITHNTRISGNKQVRCLYFGPLGLVQKLKKKYLLVGRANLCHCLTNFTVILELYQNETFVALFFLNYNYNLSDYD